MVSLGEELKRERELRDISLREISDATKISMRILEAIENNNYKLLPGGIFNRNFIRAYAEFIGVDPEGAVVKYERQSEAAPPEELPPSIVAAVKAKPVAPISEQASKRKKQIITISAIAVVILILFWVLWSTKQKNAMLPQSKLTETLA